MGFAEEDEDDEPFEVKMARLTATLAEQFEESERLLEQRLIPRLWEIVNT